MPTSQATASSLLARLDRIPIWPYPLVVLLAIGAGFFFAFFDTMIIGLVLPDIENQFHVTAKIAAWTISSGLSGYIIGAFLGGRLSDHYGRRAAIFASVGFFTIGTLFCTLSSNIENLIFWRFITGMGLGSEIAVAITLMSELTPAACRGRYTSWASSCGMFGFAVVPFVAMVLLPGHTWGWRALFLVASTSGVIIAFMRVFVPESPRWLISKNKLQQAQHIIVQAELFVEKKGGLIPELRVLTTPATPKLSVEKWFKSTYFPYLFLFTALWFFYYIGNYAWLTLGTSLFIDQGFSLTQSLGLVSLSSLGFIIGACLSIFLADKFERKWTACSILLIWSAALLCIGWFPSMPIIVINGFIASASIAALIPILYTYTAEHFPTSVRTSCVAITDGLGHLGGAVCGQVILGLYALFKPTGFGFAAAFCGMAVTGLMTVACVLGGKKVTQRSIEQ